MLGLCDRPTSLEVLLERQCGLPPGLTLAHPYRFSLALEVAVTHGGLDQAVASSSGWRLGEVLRQLPPVAEVDDWTLIEMLKGFEKLERFMHAQKVRVLADLGERRLDTQGSWSHDGKPQKTGLRRSTAARRGQPSVRRRHHGPYSGGTSRHGHPTRTRCRTPSTSERTGQRRGRPPAAFAGFSTAHWTSGGS